MKTIRTGVLLRIIPWTALLLLTLTMTWAWRQFQTDRTRHGAIRFETLLLSLTAVLLAFVVTNKVFSPQYMIWFLPLAPLLPRRHLPLFGAVFVLTGLLFPFAFTGLMPAPRTRPSSPARDLPIIPDRKVLGKLL